MQNLTNIHWIGHIKTAGDEWVTLSKTFELAALPHSAVLRLDSYGVCAVYINGKFAEGLSGRFPSRILCVECTGLLQPGENTVEIKLGSHFYQAQGKKIFARRGSWFSAVAMELSLESAAGDAVKTQTIVTDDSWQVTADDGTFAAEKFSTVNRADYDRYWRAAALYREEKPACIPDAVAKVAGPEYLAHASAPRQRFAAPVAVVQDGMTQAAPFIVYDFGRLQVGYLQLEYTAAADGEVTFSFDYTENPADFTDTAAEYYGVVQRLNVKVPLKKGTHSLQLVRRRAARFVRVAFVGGPVTVRDIRFRISILHAPQAGWFRCSDPQLNAAWDMGAYTLLINKHQEYESCPRNEMKFFSGDGIVDALVDYYAFGDDTLVDASLSLTEIDNHGGNVPDIHTRNFALWDYPAWRILMVYNQYLYNNDLALVRRYFEELVLCMDWMIHRMGDDGLIYQYPLFENVFYVESGTVEYTCSFDRLGEKPYLNALLYKSLLCMAEFAALLGDERAEQWSGLAEKVKQAINVRLWDDAAGAYRDTYDKTYIPQEGNTLAVLFGIAEGDRARRALDTLVRENWSPWGSTILSAEKPDGSYYDMHTRGGNRTISPAMCTWEAQARFAAGEAASALDLIRRCWGTMLQKGATTFWEFCPNNGTDRWPIPSHAWSGGVTYLLSAWVLGVRPAAPGWQSLCFAPCALVDGVAGVVPTPKGLVAARCELRGDKKHYTLCVPKGMPVQTALPEGAELELVEY